MNRRDVLMGIAGTPALISLFGQTSSAQVQAPTLRLFGIAFVKKREAYIDVVMPDSNDHRPFVVGTKKAVEAICDTEAKLASSYGLGVGHQDIEADRNLYAACLLRRELLAASDSDSNDDDLTAQLPHVLELAKEKTGNDSSLTAGSMSVRLTLRGGRIKRATKQGTNPACEKDIQWSFRSGAKELGKVDHITDVADFEFGGRSPVLSWVGGSLMLNPGERVWIVNVPAWAAKTKKREELPHIGHHYMIHATGVSTGELDSFWASTEKKIGRVSGSNGEFLHPCAGQTAIAYYPPDTDPCFMMQF